jgi:hypothetical protein
MIRARTVVVLVATVAIAASGCSALFVRGPKSRDGGVALNHCTESKALPVLDTAIALLAGADTLYLAGSASPTAQDFVVPFGAFAVFMSSAAYGFGATSRCTDAWNEVQTEEADQREEDAEQRARVLKKRARWAATAAPPRAAAPVDAGAAGDPDAGAAPGAEAGVVVPAPPAAPRVKQQADDE